jgi:hypothetical protein
MRRRREMERASERLLAPARVSSRGGGSPFAPEADALFARMTTAPTDARKTLVNNLIGSLKSAGVWQRLDAFYVIAAATAQAAQQNWVANAFNLSLVGAPTFTTDRGYAGDGATTYLSTGINLSAAGLKAVQDSHHMAVWVNTDTAANVADAGGSDISIGGRDVGGNITSRSASTTADTTAIAASNGWTLISRNNSADFRVDKNGVLQQTKTRTSGAFASQTLFICGRNDGAGALTAGTTRQQGAFAIGSALTEAEDLAFYNALNTYMAAVGNA